MNNGIKRIFDGVHADAALCENTYAAVCREITVRRNTGGDGLLRQPRERTKPRARAAFRFAAGCAAAFTVMFGGYSLYFTEASFVSIDVNPSIELGLNRFDRVVSVISYNEDGAEVVSGEQLMYEPYANAVTLVLERIKSAGYVNKGAYVAFTVQSSGGERREQSILSGLHGCAERLEPEARVECATVDAEMRVEAHSHGMTAGKYLASLELQSLDPAVTLDDCRDYSMGEIKRRTDECHSMNGGGNTNGNGNGNGGGGNGVHRGSAHANGNGNANGNKNAGHGHGGRHNG